MVVRDFNYALANNGYAGVLGHRSSERVASDHTHVARCVACNVALHNVQRGDGVCPAEKGVTFAVPAAARILH